MIGENLSRWFNWEEGNRHSEEYLKFQYNVNSHAFRLPSRIILNQTRWSWMKFIGLLLYIAYFKKGILYNKEIISLFDVCGCKLNSRKMNNHWSILFKSNLNFNMLLLKIDIILTVNLIPTWKGGREGIKIFFYLRLKSVTHLSHRCNAIKYECHITESLLWKY